MKVIEPWRVKYNDLLRLQGNNTKSALNVDFPNGAKTLVLALQRAGTPPTAFPVPVDGCVVLQLNLLSSHANYTRRFCLGPWQAVQFDCDPYTKFDLHILAITADSFDLVAVAVDGVEASAQAPLVYTETTPAGVGTWAVPPGADEMVAGTADAGFAWYNNDQTGNLVALPQPTTVGTTYKIAGTRYHTTDAFSAAWRIRQ